jgi:hypothetical protein
MAKLTHRNVSCANTGSVALAGRRIKRFPIVFSGFENYPFEEGANFSHYSRARVFFGELSRSGVCNGFGGRVCENMNCGLRNLRTIRRMIRNRLSLSRHHRMIEGRSMSIKPNFSTIGQQFFYGL